MHARLNILVDLAHQIYRLTSSRVSSLTPKACAANPSMLARRQEIMKSIYRILVLASTATAALVLVPLSAVSASPAVTVTATIPVGTRPLSVAANSKTNTVYVANALSDNVSVVNGGINGVVATIPVGSLPQGIS